MSTRTHHPARPDRRPNGSGSGGLGPGDPLVRALIACVRQAHARRRAGRMLD